MWPGRGGPTNHKGSSKVEFFQDTVAFSRTPGIEEQGLRLPSLLSQGRKTLDKDINLDIVIIGSHFSFRR